MTRLSFVAAILATCCACSPAAPVRAAPNIRFAVYTDDHGKAQLRLKSDFDGKHHGDWSQTVAFADLQGLSAETLRRDGPVHFDMVRPAGRFACDGQAHDAQADGRCSFTPNESFGGALEARGIGRPDESQTFALAMSGVNIDWFDALHAEGWNRPTIDQAVALGIFKVTPDFVHALGRAGYKGGKVDTLVAFRIHGVSPETIGAFGAIGYRQLSPDTLLAFRIHGVTPDYVRAMAELGYRDIPAQTLIQLRIFNITPEYVRSLGGGRKLDVSAEQLVKLRIAGIGPGDLETRH